MKVKYFIFYFLDFKNDKLENIRSDIYKLLDNKDIQLKTSPKKYKKIDSLRNSCSNKEDFIFSFLKKDEHMNNEDFFQNTRRVNKMKDILIKTLKKDNVIDNKLTSRSRLNNFNGRSNPMSRSPSRNIKKSIVYDDDFDDNNNFNSKLRSPRNKIGVIE